MTATHVDVEPRVFSPRTGDRLRLVDAVENLLLDRNRGILRLNGQRVEVIAAAERLCSAFGDQICDGTRWEEPQIALAASQRLVIVGELLQAGAAISLQLAPWEDDEILDYLLAHHRQNCTILRERIRSSSNFWRPTTANGWRLALSALALNPACKTLKQAVECVIDTHCASDTRFQLTVPRPHGGLGGVAEAVTERAETSPPTIPSLIWGDCAYSNCMEFRHWMLCMREKRFPWNFRGLPIPSLVDEIVLGIQEEQIDWRFLLEPRKFDTSYQPLAATLICKLDSRWRPDSKHWTLLGKGNFDGVDWSDFHFEGHQNFLMQFRSASFIRAKLVSAKLRQLGFQDAAFMSADLRNSIIEDCDLANAEFSNASLRETQLRAVNAPDASFRSADFTHATLDSCNLMSANFASAELSSSILVRVELTHAIFSEATLKDALFKHCSFNQCDLTTAKLDGASFQECAMDRCKLEGVRADDVNFDKSDLSNAWLTGSVLKKASFRSARLRDAALGDIDWEGANLFGADLSGVSFHFGSTRSGLVGSPYPSHGTRTGFYTDDYFDQGFRSPEEIRSANLRGADLRGANLANSDFYLVDLRGAMIDEDALPHLRKCKAILS